MILFGDITTLIALRFFVSLTSEELFIPNVQHSRKIQQLVTPFASLFWANSLMFTLRLLYSEGDYTQCMTGEKLKTNDCVYTC